MGSIFEKYSEMLTKSGFRINPLLWVIACTVFSIIPSAVFYYFFPEMILPVIALFLAILDISIGYPYFSALKRIDAVETALPQTLRQMADILKSGGTYEYALKEVSTSATGPIKEELEKILRKLEEGENFENAFRTLSENVDSRLVQRTVSIIIDAVQSGAGLAEVLDQIADDVRDLHRIARERKSKTMMQVMFMAMAGGIVAPVIFGFSASIMEFLIQAGKIAAEEAAIKKAEDAVKIIQLGIQVYLIAEVLACALLIALMRDGSIKKSILYFPILLLIAYVCYYLGAIISGLMIGGVS
jgi:archaellum biogenesis protein FlaJ (TadC family)